MKRVVTGHDEAGKAVFTSIGMTPRIAEPLPGVKLIEMWATDGPPWLPDSQSDPVVSMASFVPAIGGTRFRIFTIPPDVPVDPDNPEAAAVLKEAFEEAIPSIPGLGEALEIDNPGMHTTDTIDYIAVISGEGLLELDDGVSVTLTAGDCVIQRGTRHAWRNPGEVPLVAAAVMVGAQREGEPEGV